MAEALVSVVLEQLTSILRAQIDGQIRLIGGAEEHVRMIQSKLLAIQAVVDDAEKRQVREKDVKLWLDKLKDTSYDIEDVLDEWNTAIQRLRIKPTRKVCYFIPTYWVSPRQVVLRHKTATEIQNLNKTLDDIAREKDVFSFSPTKAREEVLRSRTTSVLDESKIHGRDHLKQTVVNLLLSESSQASTQIPIISLVGMGGIGKTTLAKLAFNDDKVKTHFNKNIWVCVSEPFEETRIAKAILESLIGQTPNLVELDSLLQEIRRSLEGKKFFLVLDDVWTEEFGIWEQILDSLKCGSKGSRILVTTRKENVARVMRTTNMIPIGLLSDNDCWSIFCSIAFFGRSDDERSELENIGRQIVDKCKGLPLAVKTLGGLLLVKTKTEEWKRILDSELWKLEEVEPKVEPGLFTPLLLSYYDLPFVLKKCFSYCAIFPKDYKLDKEKLIRLWMAQDYLKVEGREDMELVGEEYFDNLASRSLFQDFQRSKDGREIISCKMHDIVHDFTQFLAKTECFTVDMGDHRESGLELSSRKARHQMIMVERHFQNPFIYHGEIKLRSLVIDSRNYFVIVEFSKVLSQLTCLRTIDLDYRGDMFDYYSGMFYYYSGRELGEGIKKLIHLRYLNLGRSANIVELPDALCDLYNLQTLDVSGCLFLRRLPERIGELINLRHLINGGTDELSYMPKGLERLTCLRTLNVFVASGGSYGSKACTLECLKNLKHLRGSLRLTHLGDARDIGEKVDQQSNMNLLDLILEFDEDKVEHEVVLESLQPPACLERLDIINLNGKTISPNWMVSLTKLRILHLYDCRKCERLPSLLAKLPSLETLHLREMESVKRVGNEFLGIEGRDMEQMIAFPKLKSLTFDGMYDWEEWDDYEIKGEKDTINKIMPCLCELRIKRCSKLKALPDYLLRSTTLNSLSIRDSDNLQNRYKKPTGEDWPKIAHIPKVDIDP